MNESKIKVLIDEDRIRIRVKELGAEIKQKFVDVDEPIVLIGILKGSLVFMADLCRAIERPVKLEFMGVSSYGSATISSGDVRITHDLSSAIKDRHVIIVEDIIDTGLTMKYLIQMMKAREPKSLSICSFLEKPSKSKGEVHIDFLGFSIPDQFVIGYGLDYAELYRNLPYLGLMGE